jgi:hypothetical protein
MTEGPAVAAERRRSRRSRPSRSRWASNATNAARVYTLTAPALGLGQAAGKSAPPGARLANSGSCPPRPPRGDGHPPLRPPRPLACWSAGPAAPPLGRGDSQAAAPQERTPCVLGRCRAVVGSHHQPTGSWTRTHHADPRQQSASTALGPAGWAPAPSRPGRPAGRTADSGPAPPASRAVRSSLRSGTPVPLGRPAGALDPSTAGPLRRPASPRVGEEQPPRQQQRQVRPLEQ